MIKKEEFIEYARVHGNIYGTSRAAVNKARGREHRPYSAKLQYKGYKARATRLGLGTIRAAVNKARVNGLEQQSLSKAPRLCLCHARAPIPLAPQAYPYSAR